MREPPAAKGRARASTSERSSANTTDGQAVVALVDDLLDRGLACGASDIHFEPIDDPQTGLLVRVRLGGLLHDFETLPSSVAESVIGRLARLFTCRSDRLG